MVATKYLKQNKMTDDEFFAFCQSAEMRDKRIERHKNGKITIMQPTEEQQVVLIQKLAAKFAIGIRRHKVVEHSILLQVLFYQTRLLNLQTPHGLCVSVGRLYQRQ